MLLKFQLPRCFIRWFNQCSRRAHVSSWVSLSVCLTDSKSACSRFARNPPSFQRMRRASRFSSPLRFPTAVWFVASILVETIDLFMNQQKISVLLTLNFSPSARKNKRKVKKILSFTLKNDHCNSWFNVRFVSFLYPLILYLKSIISISAS